MSWCWSKTLKKSLLLYNIKAAVPVIIIAEMMRIWTNSHGHVCAGIWWCVGKHWKPRSSLSNLIIIIIRLFYVTLRYSCLYNVFFWSIALPVCIIVSKKPSAQCLSSRSLKSCSRQLTWTINRVLLLSNTNSFRHLILEFKWSGHTRGDLPYFSYYY